MHIHMNTWCEPTNNMCVYIYIYIYGCSLTGWFQPKNPLIYSKTTPPKKTYQISGVFVFRYVLFFLILVVFCPSCVFFWLCFPYILKPESYPPSEVTDYIYIYICCGVIIWSKFGPFGSYYLVQVVFFLKHRLPKNTIKIGVSALFLEKELRAKNLEVIIWSKLAFFKTQSTWTR